MPRFVPRWRAAARGDAAAPARGPDRSPVSPRRAAFLLAIVSLLVYNANGRVIAAGDTLPARFIPFSILLDRTVAVDRLFRAEYEHLPPQQRARIWFLRPSHGHLYSAYPVALPVLVTPLYAPFVWAKGAWTDREIRSVAPEAEKLAASVIAALSVAVMYLLLAGMTEARIALALTVAFAFGTTTWTASSQALWQHGAGVLLILLTLAVLARRPRLLWLAGTFAGLAVAVRPNNLFFWLALLVVCGRTRPLRALPLALPGVVIGAAVAAYNLSVFGDLRGGYAGFAGSAGFLGANAWTGLAGELVSPSRGLFVYSPVLLAGLAGGWIAWRDGRLLRSPVLAIAALFVLSQLALVATWGMWWGGWSYGPRMLTEAAAALVLLSVPAAERLGSRGWARLGFAAALAVSVAVQAIGAFAYDTAGGWNQFPENVDLHPRRLWDWRDSQIRRTAGILLQGGSPADASAP
ncbi:MAG TPA: hypothetical protein VF092_09025 [Longimicrobium sp.]